MHTRELEFIDNGNAPEFFVTALHDALVMGGVTRFTYVVVRRSPGGILYREHCFSFVMPNEGILPSINVTLDRTGPALAVPDPVVIARRAPMQ
jgi:hypothetical protein